MERYQPSLGAALNFTAQDLEANRMGELSPNQRRLLDNLKAFEQQTAAKSGGSMLVGTLVLALVLAAIGAALYFTGMFKMLLGENELYGVGGFALLAVLLIIMVRRAQRENVRMFAEMAAQPIVQGIKAFEGTVNTVREQAYSTKDSPEYVYSAIVYGASDQRKLRITEKAMGVFEHGRIYVVYYYDDGYAPMFLSVEPSA